jgi:hypothetical protein
VLRPLKVTLPIFAKAGVWRKNARQWVNSEPPSKISTGSTYLLIELLSDKKISEYLRRELSVCQSLARLSPESVDKLIQGEMARARTLRKSIIWVILVWILGQLALLAVRTFEYAVYADGSILVLVVLSMVIIELRSDHGQRREEASWQLFTAIRTVETNAKHWHSPSTVKYLTWQLESIAKAVERIPLQFKWLPPVIRRDAALIGRRKAQAIRELERWALMPGPFTYTDLLHRLTQDLCLVIDGRWYDLPEAKWERQKPRWMIFAQVFVGILFFTGTLAIVEWSGKFGRTGTLLASLLLTIATGFISNSGLSLKIVEGSAEVGSKLLGR